MATCKYTFTGADGKSTTIEGIPALKEFLLQGALEQYLPSRAAEMLAPKADEDVGAPFDVAFSGRQTPVKDWPRTEEPDGFEAKPGDSITVIRLANMEGLVNTNAASVQGLASYISMVDDGETGAGSEGVNSDNIYVYKVKVPEGGFGEYSLLRAGKPVVGGAVKKAGRQEARYGGYWYSFTEGTEADLLATVPLADVRKAAAAIEREQADSAPWSKAPLTEKQAAELKGDFDRIGTEAGAKALRDAFAAAGISLSRREQKNAAASRVSNVSSDRFKRTDELQQAVTDLQEGKITQDEYNAMVDNLRPVYPYEKVPALTNPTDAKYALANGRGQSPEKAAKYGLPSNTLAKGDFAQLRLDIPSYQEHDSWVVSVHTPKSTNREVQAAYDAGTVIGYESVAAMTDVTFGMNQKAATKIAQGTSKGTIATMLGKWKPISNQAAKVRADAAIKDSAWTQVGMDPFRHSYFYDRDTMQ
jgi:transposase